MSSYLHTEKKISKQKQTCLRTITAWVLLCFMTESSGAAAVASQTYPQAWSENSLLPPALGRVVRYDFSTDGKDPSPLILHIQDAHGIPGAQRTIFKLLRYGARRYGWKHVFVEGAVHPLNPESLRLFRSRARNEKVWQKLVGRGVLTGADLAVLRGKGGIEAQGVEEGSVYRRHLTVFRRIHRREAFSQGFVEASWTRIERTGSRYAAKSLWEFARLWWKFDTGKLPLIDYMPRLVEMAREKLRLDLESYRAQLEWPNLARLEVLRRLEKGLDLEKTAAEKEHFTDCLKKGKFPRPLIHSFSNLEKETDLRPLFEEYFRRARKGRSFSLLPFPHFLAWARYRILAGELDERELFKEVERLSRRLMQALAFSKEEKLVVSMIERLSILRRLLTLALTREEWEKVERGKGAYAPSRLARDLENLTQSRAGRRRVDPGAKGAGRVFVEACLFYRLAVARDRLLVENTLRHMARRKLRQAVLITGGFHAGGLETLFRERKVSFLSIMPKIKDAGGSELYVSRMMHHAPAYGSSHLAPPDALDESLIASIPGERAYVDREALSAQRDVTGFAASLGETNETAQKSRLIRINSHSYWAMAPSVAAEWLRKVREMGMKSDLSPGVRLTGDLALIYPGNVFPPIEYLVYFDEERGSLVLPLYQNGELRGRIIFPLKENAARREYPGVAYFVPADGSGRIYLGSVPPVAAPWEEGILSTRDLDHYMVALARELLGKHLLLSFLPGFYAEGLYHLTPEAVNVGPKPKLIEAYKAFGGGRTFPVGFQWANEHIADLFGLNSQGEVGLIAEFGETHDFWAIYRKWLDTAAVLARSGRFPLSRNLYFYTTRLNVKAHQDRVKWKKRFRVMARALFRALGDSSPVQTIHLIGLIDDTWMTFDRDERVVQGLMTPQPSRVETVSEHLKPGKLYGVLELISGQGILADSPGASLGEALRSADTPVYKVLDSIYHTWETLGPEALHLDRLEAIWRRPFGGILPDAEFGALGQAIRDFRRRAIFVDEIKDFARSQGVRGKRHYHFGAELDPKPGSEEHKQGVFFAGILGDVPEDAFLLFFDAHFQVLADAPSTQLLGSEGRRFLASSIEHSFEEQHLGDIASVLRFDSAAVQNLQEGGDFWLSRHERGHKFFEIFVKRLRPQLAVHAPDRIGSMIDGLNEDPENVLLFGKIAEAMRRRLFNVLREELIVTTFSGEWFEDHKVNAIQYPGYEDMVEEWIGSQFERIAAKHSKDGTPYYLDRVQNDDLRERLRSEVLEPLKVLYREIAREIRSLEADLRRSVPDPSRRWESISARLASMPAEVLYRIEIPVVTEGRFDPAAWQRWLGQIALEVQAEISREWGEEFRLEAYPGADLDSPYRVWNVPLNEVGGLEVIVNIHSPWIEPVDEEYEGLADIIRSKFQQRLASSFHEMPPVRLYITNYTGPMQTSVGEGRSLGDMMGEIDEALDRGDRGTALSRLEDLTVGEMPDDQGSHEALAGIFSRFAGIYFTRRNDGALMDEVLKFSEVVLTYWGHLDEELRSPWMVEKISFVLARVATYFRYQDDYDSAIAVLETALETKPDDVHNLFNMTSAYESKGDVQRAAAYLANFLRADPGLEPEEDTKKKQYLALARPMIQMFPKGVTFLSRNFRRDEEQMGRLLENLGEGLSAFLNRLMPMDLDASSMKIIAVEGSKIVRHYRRQDRYEEALALSDAILRLEEQPNPFVLHNRGTVLRRLRRLEEAKATFERLFTSVPAGFDVKAALKDYSMLGVDFLEARQRTEAIEVFTRVLNLHPDDNYAHFYLALAYAREDQPAEALDYLMRVTLMEEDPLFQNTTFYNFYAEITTRLVRYYVEEKPGPEGAEGRTKLAQSFSRIESIMAKHRHVEITEDAVHKIRSNAGRLASERALSARSQVPSAGPKVAAPKVSIPQAAAGEKGAPPRPGKFPAEPAAPPVEKTGALSAAEAKKVFERELDSLPMGVHQGWLEGAEWTPRKIWRVARSIRLTISGVRWKEPRGIPVFINGVPNQLAADPAFRESVARFFIEAEKKPGLRIRAEPVIEIIESALDVGHRFRKIRWGDDPDPKKKKWTDYSTQSLMINAVTFGAKYERPPTPDVKPTTPGAAPHTSAPDPVQMREQAATKIATVRLIHKFGGNVQDAIRMASAAVAAMPSGRERNHMVQELTKTVRSVGLDPARVLAIPPAPEELRARIQTIELMAKFGGDVDGAIANADKAIRSIEAAQLRAPWEGELAGMLRKIGRDTDEAARQAESLERARKQVALLNTLHHFKGQEEEAVIEQARAAVRALNPGKVRNDLEAELEKILEDRGPKPLNGESLGLPNTASGFIPATIRAMAEDKALTVAGKFKDKQGGAFYTLLHDFPHSLGIYAYGASGELLGGISIQKEANRRRFYLAAPASRRILRGEDGIEVYAKGKGIGGILFSLALLYLQEGVLEVRDIEPTALPFYRSMRMYPEEQLKNGKILLWAEDEVGALARRNVRRVLESLQGIWDVVLRDRLETALSLGKRDARLAGEVMPVPIYRSRKTARGIFPAGTRWEEAMTLIYVTRGFVKPGTARRHSVLLIRAMGSLLARTQGAKPRRKIDDPAIRAFNENLGWLGPELPPDLLALLLDIDVLQVASPSQLKSFASHRTAQDIVAVFWEGRGQNVFQRAKPKVLNALIRALAPRGVRVIDIHSRLPSAREIARRIGALRREGLWITGRDKTRREIPSNMTLERFQFDLDAFTRDGIDPLQAAAFLGRIVLIRSEALRRQWYDDIGASFDPETGSWHIGSGLAKFIRARYAETKRAEILEQAA
jgi:tetratricopeptide (TPR) repeat protein